jgi:hypothetical protein
MASDSRTRGRRPTGQDMHVEVREENEPDDGKTGGSSRRLTGGKVTNNTKIGRSKRQVAGRKMAYLSGTPRAKGSDRRVEIE